MQLHRVRLLNFRQHADTDLEFGPGITAIIGPNGAGKTTILEAIAWAFFGSPAARGNRDTIRWSRAPARSPVQVEVEFSLGAHQFRVLRGLYRAELYQDRFDRPIVSSHQEVSARVERILGMTRDEFFNTYFTSQKELAVMAAMGPTDRGRFLSRVLGYERLRLAQERVREVRSALRAELQGLERGLMDREALERERNEAAAQVVSAREAVAAAAERRAAAEQRLATEGPAWTTMVELRESALSLDGERRVAERDVGEARREFERLDREMAEALAARSRLEELRPTVAGAEPLRAELERLEREARNAGRRRSMTGQIQEVDAQRGRLEERMTRLSDVHTALEVATAELQAARAALQEAGIAEERARTAWVRDRQDAETKRQSLRDHYLDLQKHRGSVLEAGVDGECPVCKRPLGVEYQEVLDTLARQIEEVEVRGKFFRQRIEQLGAPPPDVNEAETTGREASARVERALQEVARCENRMRERHEIEAELETLSARGGELGRELATLPDEYDAERHDAVREELRALEPTLQLATELGVKAARAEQLVAEAEAAERTLSERETRVRSLDTALADLGFSEERHADARRRYEEAEHAVRESALAEASMRGDVRAAETALDSAQRRLREREGQARQVAELRIDVRLHDELDRAYHELRQELNATMRPELAARASELLSALTDGRYHELELDESYELLVVEDGQGKPVISGGEEDVTHLVLRLAISQMVAERAGQPLSLLVLDEIFGSLDEHRRHNVVRLLRALADRFPQVILITHIESVREGVDRVVRVVLDERAGAARVTEDVGEADDVAA